MSISSCCYPPKASFSGAPTPQAKGLKAALWSYVADAINKLVASISFFIQGFPKREKYGITFTVNYPIHNLTQDKIDQLAKFRKFDDLVQKSCLKASEAKKGMQLLTECFSAAYDEGAAGNTDKQAFYIQQANAYARLIAKNNHPRFSKDDFDLDDWQGYDQIKFAMIKDSISEATELFNASWFQELGHFDVLQTEFQINYYESLIAEILAFSLAYIEGVEGQTISLPLKKDNVYELVPYTIKKIRLGDNLPGFILESDSPQVDPWLVIRGTQRFMKIAANGEEYRQGSLESILADFVDPKCIVRHVLNKSLVSQSVVNQCGDIVKSESLSEIFSRWKQANKAPILCGHSLGGTLANGLGIEFYHDVRRVYGFNPAGMSRKMAERWKKREADFPQESPKIINFDNEGDIIPSTGSKLVGHHIALSAPAQISSASTYQTHIRSILHRGFEIQKIDLDKENDKFVRVFCERIRVIFSRGLRFCLLFTNAESVPEWWKNRHIYKTKAFVQRKINRTANLKASN